MYFVLLCLLLFFLFWYNSAFLITLLLPLSLVRPPLTLALRHRPNLEVQFSKQPNVLVAGSTFQVSCHSFVGRSGSLRLDFSDTLYALPGASSFISSRIESKGALETPAGANGWDSFFSFFLFFSGGGGGGGAPSIKLTIKSTASTAK